MQMLINSIFQFKRVCIILFCVINFVALLIPESIISQSNLALLLGMFDGFGLLWFSVNYTDLLPPYNVQNKEE